MNRLKGLIISLASAALLTACGPSHILLQMERSVPAEKDIDIENRVVGILLNERGMEQDSVAYLAYAEGFAKMIESRKQMAEGALPVFVGNTANSVGEYSYNFSDLDLLFVINQVTGNNVSVKESYVMENGMTYMIEADARLDYQVYDLHSGTKVDSVCGMNAVQWYEETDFTVSPDDVLETLPYTKSEVYNYFGRKTAEKYFGDWRTVDRTLLVYENEPSWVDAYFAAMGFRWDDAIKFWMNRTEYGSREETAVAAYNLAVAFEVSGAYDLALKWLDMSDHISKQSCSDRERMIIENAVKASNR